MRLYAGLSTHFIRDTVHNQIAEKLKTAYFEYYRCQPSASEIQSWRNSLRASAQVPGWAAPNATSSTPRRRSGGMRHIFRTRIRLFTRALRRSFSARAPTSTTTTPRTGTSCIRMASNASEQPHRSFLRTTSVLSRTT
jgi:hypothetical protein